MGSWLHTDRMMCWGVHVNKGERSDSRDVARRSRGCSCLVTLPDGRCDNDDATSDSITCSCILIYVFAIGVRLGVLLWCGCCSSRRSYIRYYRDDMLR